jgi:hypothetical protein
MSILRTCTRAFGVSLLENHPEKFVVHAPDGQQVCKFTMTLVEHPQVIGAWLLRVDSHPGDAATMVTKAQGPNLYWSTSDGGNDGHR